MKAEQSRAAKQRWERAKSSFDDAVADYASGDLCLDCVVQALRRLDDADKQTAGQEADSDANAKKPHAEVAYGLYLRDEFSGDNLAPACGESIHIYGVEDDAYVLSDCPLTPDAVEDIFEDSLAEMEEFEKPIFQSALDRGLSIIPIPPLEKSTKLDRWPERAVNDAAIMEGLPENYNYGVVANDTFCVLDIDNPISVDTFGLLDPKVLWPVNVELPPTYTVKTSRGKHLYFRHTEKSRRLGNCSVGVFDFLAKDRYVVGEGSTHPSGHTYVCIDESDIAEIPDALVDALDQCCRRRGDDIAAITGGQQW